MTDAIVALESSSFDTAVSDGHWLVDFWTPGCAPCHALHPVLERIAASRSDIEIGRVDITASPDLAERFSIRTAPTMVVFRDGSPVSRMVGAKSDARIRMEIDKLTHEDVEPG